MRLTALPTAGKPPETADFYDGLFTIHKVGGFIELRAEREAHRLPEGPQRRRAAQKKPKSRKLWGDGKGKFRTRGQYSAATVRGTKWLVQDTCTTTLTRVTQGVVAVNDFAKRRPSWSRRASATPPAPSGARTRRRPLPAWRPWA